MSTVTKPILISPFPAQLSGEPAAGLPASQDPCKGPHPSCSSRALASEGEGASPVPGRVGERTQ